MEVLDVEFWSDPVLWVISIVMAVLVFWLLNYSMPPAKYPDMFMLKAIATIVSLPAGYIVGKMKAEG